MRYGVGGAFQHVDGLTVPNRQAPHPVAQPRISISGTPSVEIIGDAGLSSTNSMVVVATPRGRMHPLDPEKLLTTLEYHGPDFSQISVYVHPGAVPHLNLDAQDFFTTGVAVGGTIRAAEGAKILIERCLGLDLTVAPEGSTRIGTAQGSLQLRTVRGSGSPHGEIEIDEVELKHLGLLLERGTGVRIGGGSVEQVTLMGPCSGRLRAPTVRSGMLTRYQSRSSGPTLAADI